MKKIQFILVVLIIFLALTPVCTSNNNSACAKVNINSANKHIKAFLNKCNDKNGIYLYDDGKDDMYLYLNNYYVVQGEKASYISDIKTEGQGKTFIISLSEKYTDDYKNKNISKKLLYKIMMPKGFDAISVYKNEKQTSFNMVGIKDD